jgi:hypothetical protein
MADARMLLFSLFMNPHGFMNTASDLQAYIGLPSEGARYKILRSCITELARSGLIQNKPCTLPPSYPAAVAGCTALEEKYSQISGSSCVPEKMTDAMHDSEAAQAMAGLQLEDLRLDAVVREELAASGERLDTHGTDSLSVVKLGARLRCSISLDILVHLYWR